MRSRLASFAVLIVSLGLVQPAHAAGPSAVPTVNVGDHVDLESGSPAPLSDGDAEVAGQAPVLDDRGVVIASSLDAYGSATTTGPDADREPTAIGPCNPVTGSDKPHVSSSENVASAHGWWRRGDCSGDKADVRACLLEWWRGKDGTSKWVTKKCKTGRIKPAKKGKRKPSVTARVACTSLQETGWANLVDVDVNGSWDNGETGYKTDNIYCRRDP